VGGVRKSLPSYPPPRDYPQEATSHGQSGALGTRQRLTVARTFRTVHILCARDLRRNEKFFYAKASERTDLRGPTYTHCLPAGRFIVGALGGGVAFAEAAEFANVFGEGLGRDEEDEDAAGAFVSANPLLM
jgi:hypothetical protein